MQCRFFAVVILLQLGVAAYGTVGVPLPSVCLGSRGDHTPLPDQVSTVCDEKIPRRFFYNQVKKRCKRFPLCATVADYLDQEADPNLNYFQSMTECQEACTNGNSIHYSIR